MADQETTDRGALQETHVGPADDVARLFEESADDPNAMKTMAQACRDRGERLCAVRCLERAVALDPDDAEAHFLLGDVLDECDEEARAVQAYDRSLELAPLNPVALAQRGRALLLLGRVDEALESHRRAIAIDPHHLASLAALAAIWFHQDRWELAGSCLALIRPSDLASSMIVATNVRTIASQVGAKLAQEDRWLEAARVFEVACGLAPEDADCCFNHAICLFHADAYRDAWARLRHVLDLDPAHGQASHLMPRFEEAAGRLREVRGYGSLMASFSLHTVRYRDSFGRGATMFNVVVPLETQTQFVRTESERLSLDSDRHLLDLLLAKGHNARLHEGLEGRPMVFAVSVEPDPEFTSFAASRSWMTASGSLIESAPVPVLYAPAGIPERSLLPETDGPFQLQRTLELERDGPERFYPEEYSVLS